MSMYQHTETGQVYRPGDVVGGCRTHQRMSDAAWADLGCEPYTPPEPDPAQAQAREQERLDGLQSMAARCWQLAAAAGYTEWPVDWDAALDAAPDLIAAADGPRAAAGAALLAARQALTEAGGEWTDVATIAAREGWEWPA